MNSFIKKIYDFITSLKWTISIISCLLLLLIPQTLIANRSQLLALAINMILLAIGFTLLLCTLKNIKRFSKSVLVIHFGVLLVLAGSAMSSLGYIATINIYEGDSVTTVYRWDVEEDVPLGFTLRIVKIHRRYYPADLKIGVLKQDEKIGLFELKTGEDFSLDEYRVHVQTLDPIAEIATLEILGSDSRVIGTTSTAASDVMDQDFPYTFRLVAYKSPILQKIWVDLEIDQADAETISGTTAVNAPFLWNGLRFYNTKIDLDQNRIPYAGIQIVDDPGIPGVYLGFAVICLGLLLHLHGFIGKMKRKDRE